MYDSTEVFDDLSMTARNDAELNLIDKYVRGEKLRIWLTTSKEGQAISQQIEYLYCRALDDFSNCDITEKDKLEKAKFDLTVAKGIYEIFNGVFQDANTAETLLSEE